MAAKPPGYEILNSRIESIPLLFPGWSAQMSAGIRAAGDLGGSFAITGIGASEAHARYLAALLSSCGRSAAFWPLSSFVAGHALAKPADNLVVISQGLSPNAWLAISHRKSFKRLLVLTTCDPEKTPSKEKGAGAKSADVSARLRGLLDEGAVCIRFPLENEFEVLLRVVGPVFGYLACHRLVSSLGFSLPQITEKELTELCSRSKERGCSLAADPVVSEGSRGVHLLAPFPLSSYAQNLSLKIQEALFWHVPKVWDYLDLSHGLQQQLSANPHPVIVLSSGEQSPLLGKVGDLLRAVGAPFTEVRSSLPPFLEIVEHEMVFNHFVLALIEKYGIDQLSWPGKGLDQALYAFSAE